MTKKTAKKKYKFILISILFLCCIIFAVGYFSYKKIISVIDTDRIYKNIFVNEIDIGDLKKDDAIKKINSVLQEPLNQKIIKLHDRGQGKEYDFSFKDFNATYEIKKIVDEAYNYAREGNFIKRYEKVVKLKKNPLKLNVEYNINRDFVQSKLNEIESSVYVKPKNASLYKINGEFITVDGTDGKKLDLEKNLDLVMNLLNKKESGDIDLIFESVKPKYNKNDFGKTRDVIGSYKTVFGGKKIDRNQNIINAAKKINNNIIYPGEIYSLNDNLKPFSVKNGYVNAPIIVNGKLTDGIGGGICQVSTVLYNAVLYSELEIVERKNHSLKVGYIDYGFDATLAGDYIDLKFKNNKSVPLLIETVINGNNLVVNIYGEETRPKNRKITFKNELVETIPAPTETIVYTNELPEGTKKFESYSKKGFRYKLYKMVYESGVQKEKILVNTSYYRPTRGTVKIGTKKIESKEKIENNNENQNTTENQIETENQNDSANEIENDNNNVSENENETSWLTIDDKHKKIKSLR